MRRGPRHNRRAGLEVPVWNQGVDECVHVRHCLDRFEQRQRPFNGLRLKHPAGAVAELGHEFLVAEGDLLGPPRMIHPACGA